MIFFNNTNVSKVIKRLIQLIFFLIVFMTFRGQAQDPQFSQFFAAPLYLNPAFTGATEEHRFVANYRNQWYGYTTYSFSYDHNIEHLNSGFGLLATVDKAGSLNMSTTNIGFLYAYKVRLSDKWILTPGIHFAYGNRGIDREKIILLDQLGSGSPDSPSNDPLLFALGNTDYFDFSSGLLAYNKMFWAGFSVHHMNKPNLTVTNRVNKLSVKTSLHGGARIPLYHGPFKRNVAPSIAPSFIYQRQGNVNQLDVGMNFHYNPIMVGFGYRSILDTKNEFTEKVSQGTLIFLIGLHYEQLEFGYSYDFTLSPLSASSGGAHEISLAYHLTYTKKQKPKRKDKFIPCPPFLSN